MDRFRNMRIIMRQEIKTKFLSIVPKSELATDATQAIKDEYEKGF